ncbi:MAG: M23 family metallopeptidase [Anaerolineae bacterium]|nr:M23 family metallopeptidase [Anaerolineae bacterium]
MKVLMCRPRCLWLLLLCLLAQPAGAQDQQPLILPFQQPPGPHTWLLGQPYGNTIGAYNFGTNWYSAGQGLHFGLDFSAPCGTPLVAVADGMVVAVDNFAYGSRPHNLLIRHDAYGLVSLYGHLNSTPDLVEGQFVTQGQIVGYTGDPDVTCDSRPHLHYELRSLDYRTAYNPVPFMQAHWHSLALIGSFGTELFQMDVDNARRWMSLDDQPNVSFGGARLNTYAAYYPPALGVRPPPNPPLPHTLPALTQPPAVTLTRIGYDECCRDFYWHPTRPETFYTVDGLAGQRAMIFEWSAATAAPVGSGGVAPRPLLSPDATLETLRSATGTQIRRLADNLVWEVPIPPAANLPGISADNSRLVWWEQSAVVPPGQTQPDTAMFVSDLTAQTVLPVPVLPGSAARWLDASRLLISHSQRSSVTLEVYETATGARYTLGTWYRLRGLTIAPGGGHLLFYLTGQPNAADSAIYLLPTTPGAVPQPLPWFGGWRWRDATSLYYVPFNPQSAVQQLVYYDIATGASLPLTDPAAQPFAIMNSRWEVSADGRSLLFHNLADRNLWLLTLDG